MQFLIVSIGKTKFKFYQEAIDHYCKAIQPMAAIEFLTLKEAGNTVEKEEKALLECLERRKILKDGKNRIIVLDETGKSLSSQEFSQKIVKLENQGVTKLCFVIGGAYGLSNHMKDRAHEVWSLSQCTFTHDLARVVLLEQIYRALHIKLGTKYHHKICN